MYVDARRGRVGDARSPRAGVRVLRVHESLFPLFFSFFFFFSLLVEREREPCDPNVELSDATPTLPGLFVSPPVTGTTGAFVSSSRRATVARALRAHISIKIVCFSCLKICRLMFFFPSFSFSGGRRRIRWRIWTAANWIWWRKHGRIWSCWRLWKYESEQQRWRRSQAAVEQADAEEANSDRLYRHQVCMAFFVVRSSRRA